MTKILHIIQRTSYDGAAILPQRLISDLPDYDHHLLACYKGSAHDEFSELGVKLIYLSNSETIKKYSAGKFFSFFFFLLKNKFDIIHYHHGGVGLLFISYLIKRKKIIHHIHTGNITGRREDNRIPLLQKLLLKFIDKRIITISAANHVRDFYLKNIFRRSKISVVTNFCPFAFKQKNVITKKIGYLGRITLEKGFSYFNSIALHISEVDKDITFWIKGNINEELQDDLSANIKIIEPSLSIKEFLEEMDMIIFLSNAPEAMPLVILEAVNYDVGIICPEVEYSKEIFNKNYPLLIKYIGINEVMEKIKFFYSNRFDRQVLTKIHKNIYERYNKEKILPKYYELYERLPTK